MSAPTFTALFDLDGTLVDSNYLHAVAWWEAFAQAGHDVPMGTPQVASQITTAWSLRPRLAFFAITLRHWID